MGECINLRRSGNPKKLPILNANYPQDVTTTVIKGNTTSATFTAVISEAGNPASYTYQWYVNGSAVSGATGSSYTMSGLSETAAYSVYCEITNKAGTVQTRAASLKVTQYYTPVLNTSYPANVTGATVGGSATFKVTIATAGNPASYTYQWYVNGSAVNGATGATYTRSNLTLGTYTVYCKVTNAAGTAQSRTATLTCTKQYLYNSGDLCTSLTGGWVVKNKATFTNGASYFTAKESDEDYVGYIGTSKTIDLTKINSIKITYSFNGGNSSAGLFVQNTTFPTTGTTSWSKNVAFVQTTKTGSLSTYTTVTLDTSALSGFYTVYMGVYGTIQVKTIVCNT